MKPSFSVNKSKTTWWKLESYFLMSHLWEKPNEGFASKFFIISSVWLREQTHWNGNCLHWMCASSSECCGLHHKLVITALDVEKLLSSTTVWNNLPFCWNIRQEQVMVLSLLSRSLLPLSIWNKCIWGLKTPCLLSKTIKMNSVLDLILG